MRAILMTPSHSFRYRLALEPQVASRPLRLYTDMCADLFHTGHVNYLRQCRGIHDNVHLIVGIHSDATIESYVTDNSVRLALPPRPI